MYSNNAIYPYSLCYLNAEGEIFIPGNNPKRCLDYFKKLCLGRNEVAHGLIAEFNQQTKSGRFMDAYISLMDKAITNITGICEELGIDSLAFPGGTRISQKEVDSPFELISFLIIK